MTVRNTKPYEGSRGYWHPRERTKQQDENPRPPVTNDDVIKAFSNLMYLVGEIKNGKPKLYVRYFDMVESEIQKAYAIFATYINQ